MVTSLAFDEIMEILHVAIPIACVVIGIVVAIALVSLLRR